MRMQTGQIGCVLRDEPILSGEQSQVRAATSPLSLPRRRIGDVLHGACAAHYCERACLLVTIAGAPVQFKGVPA
jgi:hypothetical protein